MNVTQSVMYVPKPRPRVAWYRRFIRAIISDRWYLLMILPGLICLLLFNYLPLTGILMAFQKMSLAKPTFFQNLFHPMEWVGLRNFNGYFKSPDFWTTTRNTIGYNIIFMTAGLIGNVFVAIAASEIWSKRSAKLFQSIMILPSFLSWVIISYLLYSLMDPDYGVFNGLLRSLGANPVSWYSNARLWPFILPILNLWKGVGIGSIYYFAAITGIDTEMYESALIDGATRFRQIIHITIPMLRPTMVVLTILGLGGIIRTDFGLFYVATLQMGRGSLYNTLSTIDTYTYNMLKTGKSVLGTSVGLYQSLVGLITILLVNMIVRRIDRDSAMF